MQLKEEEKLLLVEQQFSDLSLGVFGVGGRAVVIRLKAGRHVIYRAGIYVGDIALKEGPESVTALLATVVKKIKLSH